MLKRILGNGQISSEETMILFKEFHVMLMSGIDLYRCTILIKGSESVNVALKLVGESLMKGHSCSDAFVESNLVSNYEAAVLKIGEETGSLLRSFEVLYLSRKKAIDFRKKVIGMISYPAMILAMSMCVIMFMVFFVVPVFADMLFRSGQELPRLTVVILEISNFLTANGLYILILTILLFLGLIIIWRKQEFRFRLVNLAYSTWLIGDVLRLNLYYSLFESWSFMTESGITLERAMELSRSLSEYGRFQNFIDSASLELRKGSPLGTSIRESGMFSIKIANMVQIGEESGRLAEMFTVLTDSYGDSIEKYYSSFTKYFEPLTILIVATVVGLILVSLYLPMFKMMGGMNMG